MQLHQVLLLHPLTSVGMGTRRLKTRAHVDEIQPTITLVGRTQQQKDIQLLKEPNQP